MSKILLSTIVALCTLSVAPKVEAASAVAVAINSKGSLGYGYYHDPRITEPQAKLRAINECLNWRGKNPRIIASTSKLGFGIVVMFLGADNKFDYAVALAEPTREIALGEVKKKAKSVGGRAFRIVREWNDALPKKGQPIIMQKL